MKKNIGILLVVTFALVMGLIMTTCDNSGGVCEKRSLAIDEAANKCNKGTCTCIVKEYGKVNGIPVYRLKTVTDSQAITAMTNLTAGYNAMVAGKENITTSKLNAFYMGTADAWNGGEKIVTINRAYDAAGMKDALEALGGGPLAFFKQLFNDFLLASTAKAARSA